MHGFSHGRSACLQCVGRGMKMTKESVFSPFGLEEIKKKVLNKKKVKKWELQRQENLTVHILTRNVTKTISVRKHS